MQTTLAPAFAVRPITPDDRDALATFYAGLSPDSLESRFHGAAPRVSDAVAQFFCGPDHLAREGLVAETVDADGLPAIVGHLCIEPLGAERGSVAEVAVAVADAWQRRGVGRALLAAAIDWADHHGVAGLFASLRLGNAAMLNLIRSTGHPVSFGASGAGTLEAVLDVREVSAAPRAA